MSTLVAGAAILVTSAIPFSRATEWIASIEANGDIVFSDNSLQIDKTTPFDTSYFQKKLLRHYYKISIETDDLVGEVITIAKNEEPVFRILGGENGKTRFISIESDKVKGPTGKAIGDKLTDVLGSKAECEAGGDDWFACWSKEYPNIYYRPSCWDKIATGTNQIPTTCTITEISIGFGE